MYRLSCVTVVYCLFSACCNKMMTEKSQCRGGQEPTKGLHKTSTTCTSDGSGNNAKHSRESRVISFLKLSGNPVLIVSLVKCAYFTRLLPDRAGL